ncbi:SAVED domain-containing protein [Paraburkholderia strydomiana]|uniref:Hachiman antiphage defense system protein HamA n=1 Tax=Paraburkholderia strydomiana TaxID=1245417 RepID=UPI0038BC20A5
MPPPDHINWFQVHPQLTTDEGKVVTVVEFLHQPEEAVLAAWAKYFREHYCSDDHIDAMVSGTGLTRAAFLTEYVFPNADRAPGPSIRAGDFAEILVSDFLEYHLEHWVPRWRFSEKATPNQSVQGTDIIGLKLSNAGTPIEDTLTTFEVKAQLSNGPAQSRLQVAVNDAAKDKIRQGYTLHAMKRKALQTQDAEKAALVERFQNKADRPFTEQTGAAAVLSNGAFDAAQIVLTSTDSHPEGTLVLMLAIRGDDLMALAHRLYERAANEA